MKKSKIGWSLVLTISIAALIGYGAWSLQFVKRNEAFELNSNNQGMMNLPFNRERGVKDQNYQNFGGMMNGYNGNNSGRNNFGGMMGGSEFRNGDTNISSLDEETANKHMENSLKNATVNKENNTISFAGKDITIVLLAGPEIADGKFVIGGLINPSIQVPKDAKISLEMINEDEGMPHGVEITNATPPYNYRVMMGGGIYPDTFVPTLPAATVDKYPAAVTTFNTNQEGAFYYICQYPGHAAKGMYGKFIIK